MIVIERTVDISKPIQTETLRGNEFKLEANAHTFRISVANNGAAVALTGSVSASMLLADGSGLTLGGSLDNGVAVLTLPQAAYGVPGRFMLAIYSVQTGATEAETVKTCIYACVGAVVNTYGEQQYDPGNLIPDAETLAAYIEACQTATAAANTAAGRAETAALTAVTYAEQTGKTDAEKAQARTNIGAASEAVETAMADHFPATGKLVAGISTTASANGAVATGVSTTASGRASHAEGQLTTADGQVAHAEGYGTTASGDYSHAEGFGTKASGDHQHAFGKYNVEDTNGTYLEIAGNGTGDNARSNARTLDWNGNETLAGDLTVNKGGAGEMAVGNELSSLKSAIGYIENTIVEDLVFEQGNISSTGANQNDSSRIRTPDYLFCPLGFSFTVPTGYKTYIYAFTSNTQSSITGAVFSSWQTGEVRVSNFNGKFIRIIIGKTDNSALTPSSISPAISISLNTTTDKTLTVDDVAADAKTTGDRINAVSGNLLNVTNVLSFAKSNTLVFEQGHIDSSGVESNDSSRIRTGYLYCPFGFLVTVPTGYQLYGYCYTDNNIESIIGAVVNGWKTGSVTVGLYGGAFVRLLLRRTDNGVIRPSDVSISIALNDLTDTSLRRWHGKKVVWYGTSIPEGRPPLSYPFIIGNMLGCTVYNESVGSSRICFKYPVTPTEANPYCFGNNFTAASRTITNSLEEQQWIIDNYNSDIWAVGKPDTMTEDMAAKILSYSYENKIDKYLTSETFPDLFVFDYGHNDMPNSIEQAEQWYDTYGPYNLYTFRGGMNFLLKRILDYNPRARIVMIGEYAGTAESVIPYLQLQVSNDWCLPICKNWEKLGWSKSQNVALYGHWQESSGVWSWITDETQTTMSVFNAWVPDGTHPDKDLSGKAINHMANVIAKWLENEITFTP